MRELTRLERNIAAEVFARYSKRDFAYGYYKAPRQVTTTTATTATMVATTFVMPVEVVDCKAEVAGLDQSAFIDALEEYLERSKTELYNILASDNSD